MMTFCLMALSAYFSWMLVDGVEGSVGKMFKASILFLLWLGVVTNL